MGWVILIVIIGLPFLIYYLRFLVPVRKKETGFEYVYVEDDGSVREVNEEEEKYLREVFHPADSGRPYIKSRYTEKDGRGSIAGFIRRRRVRANIKIRKF